MSRINTKQPSMSTINATQPSTINFEAECKCCQRPLRWQKCIETYCNCDNPVYHAECITGLRQCPYCKKSYPSWMPKLTTLINEQNIKAKYHKQKDRKDQTEANRNKIKQKVRAILAERMMKILQEEYVFVADE